MQYSGTVRFWMAFLFLNAVLNVPFPERTPWQALVLPSLDLVALLVVFALCAAWLKPIPRIAQAALLAFFMVARLLRFADGIEQKAYHRDFTTVVDFPLLPEFFRLFYASLSLPVFVLAMLGLLAVLGLLAFSIRGSLRALERGMASRVQLNALGALVFVLAVPAAFLPHAAVFRASVLERVRAEWNFTRRWPAYRAAYVARVAAVQRDFQTHPSDLRKLRRQNVYLFLIESYGQTVLDRSELRVRVEPEYRRFETALSGIGFQLASRVLDSSTYGGRSWLAQSTALTCVPTRDQFQFELLRAAQPTTLARIFASAGYRTVLAQPGTTRDPQELFHFDKHYFLRDFGYRGPHFGWATMSDQYVLDFVRRREIVNANSPLFLTYALVASHVPWSDLPPMIDDWSTLGDGSLYLGLPHPHYPSQWLSLAGASGAYADAIVYDLEVLRRYISEFVQDDSLVIILGDHQPHSEITAGGPSYGVPVHVLSRNAEFIAPFRARGYTPGMLAEKALPHPGLETLMRDVVADFSVNSPGSTR